VNLAPEKKRHRLESKRYLSVRKKSRKGLFGGRRVFKSEGGREGASQV